MPFNLLERLLAARFPLCVEDEEDIDKLFVLSATGMLEAEIPKLRRASGPHRYDGTAVVLRVTDQGIAAVTKRASRVHVQPEAEAVGWPSSVSPILLANSGNQRQSGLQH